MMIKILIHYFCIFLILSSYSFGADSHPPLIPDNAITNVVMPNAVPVPEPRELDSEEQDMEDFLDDSFSIDSIIKEEELEDHLNKPEYSKLDKSEIKQKIKKEKAIAESSVKIEKFLLQDYNVKPLPEPIYSKKYSKVNSHLPKSVTRSDLQKYAFIAVSKGDLNNLRALIDSNSLINSVNEDGDSLIMYAVKNNQNIIVDFLLARHINLNIINKKGQNIMHLAILYNNFELANYIFNLKTVNISVIDSKEKKPIDYINNSTDIRIKKLFNLEDF